LNRADRRKAEKLRKHNLQDVARTINKYAEKYNACQTDEERQAFIDSLTAEQKREIGNATIYMKLQALNKYASLPQHKREALQRGDVSVI
jgi:hypothetical protein